MRDVQDRDAGETSLATAGRLHRLLVETGRTVACAESLTGGALADLLSVTPGASVSFRGGVVAYATDVKTTLLGVSADTITTHGAVSAECAAQMARGVRRLLGASVAVSTTGVAGPDAQEGKPVGTVFIGVCAGEEPGDVTTYRLSLTGGRPAIRAATCRAALSRLVELVGLGASPEGEVFPVE